MRRMFTDVSEVLEHMLGVSLVHELTLVEQEKVVKHLEDGVAWLMDRENNRTSLLR